MTFKQTAETSLQPGSARLGVAATGLRTQLEQWAQPLLRIFFGLDLMTHGIPKLLRIDHGKMHDPMASMPQLISDVFHLPMPGVFAYGVMLLETFGALAIVLGFQTRIIAALLTLTLFCASAVHYPTWPWGDGGMEMPILMAMVTLFFALRGAGGFSLDKRFHWEK